MLLHAACPCLLCSALSHAMSAPVDREWARRQSEGGNGRWGVIEARGAPCWEPSPATSAILQPLMRPPSEDSSGALLAVDLEGEGAVGERRGAACGRRRGCSGKVQRFRVWDNAGGRTWSRARAPNFCPRCAGQLCQGLRAPSPAGPPLRGEEVRPAKILLYRAKIFPGGVISTSCFTGWGQKAINTPRQ